MNVDAIRHFYGYHFGMNRYIWDQYIVPLSQEQYVQASTYSIGSVRDQIVHMVNVDETWFRQLGGLDFVDWRDPKAYADRDKLRAEWDQVEQMMRDYGNQPQVVEQARMGLGGVYMALQKPDQAAKMFEDVAEGAGNEQAASGALVSYAGALIEQGKLDKVDAVVKEIKERFPTDQNAVINTRMSAASSDRRTLPNSGQPKPRSHRPKAMSGSSGSSSDSSHVAAPHGQNSFTTGQKSRVLPSSSMRSVFSRPFFNRRARWSSVSSAAAPCRMFVVSFIRSNPPFSRFRRHRAHTPRA